MKKRKGAAAAQPAAAVATTITNAVAPPAGNTLTLHLIGRICLVEHGGRHAALFLDAQKNPALKFPKHSPLLRASIDDSTQPGADLAMVAIGDQNGRVQALWDLRGCDMEFEGLASFGEPVAEIDAIADLRAAYKPVDPNATWRGAELFDADPRQHGIAARLWLKGFDRIDSMFFDSDGLMKSSALVPLLSQDRTFFPGAHSQSQHAVIRCTAKFLPFALDKPALVLTDFQSGVQRRVPFDDATPVLMTFSNLCTCVGSDVDTAEKKSVSGKDLVMEDPEFALYYELLEKPPVQAARPVPFVELAGGAGGGGAPECVPSARLSTS